MRLWASLGGYGSRWVPLMNADLHSIRIGGNQRGLAVERMGPDRTFPDEISDLRSKRLIFRGLPKKKREFHAIPALVPVVRCWFSAAYAKRGVFFILRRADALEDRVEREKLLRELRRITANGAEKRTKRRGGICSFRITQGG